MGNKKFTLLLVAFLLLSLIGLQTPAHAAGSKTYGPFASTGPDSGTCGNDWANDSFGRKVVIPDTANPNIAVVYFQNGTFTTVAGQSPNACNGHPDNGNTVGAGVLGVMSGYYGLVITSGTYNPAAVCTAATCSTTAGFVNTVYGPGATYNTGPSFSFTYNTYGNGSWVNSSSGNSGDITGAYVPGPLPGLGQEKVDVGYFNPDDGRILATANDRIVVYPDDDAFQIYGVDNNGKGFFFAKFSIDDLVKAGPKGLSKHLVIGGKDWGTLSMSGTAEGYYLVAWNGGIFNATGNGDFAKFFKQ